MSRMTGTVLRDITFVGGHSTDMARVFVMAVRGATGAAVTIRPIVEHTGRGITALTDKNKKTST